MRKPLLLDPDHRSPSVRDQPAYEVSATAAPSLFDKVCDALGVTAEYIRRDVMGDIHSKLIDEAWFGRAKTATPDGPTQPISPAAPAQSLSINLHVAEPHAIDGVDHDR